LRATYGFAIDCQGWEDRMVESAGLIKKLQIKADKPEAWKTRGRQG
jgi:hypothetical protein